MSKRRPTIRAGESVADFLERMDEWKRQGDWIPACGGTEVPFFTRTRHRVLYVWQPRSGRHAYLDMGTDMIIPDDELHLYGLAPEPGHCTIHGSKKVRKKT